VLVRHPPELGDEARFAVDIELGVSVQAVIA